MKKDIKTRERFIQLRAMGWSYDRIGRELNISRNTLMNWARELKTDLANARAVATDALLDTFQAQREERLKFLAGEFAKARDELKGRELVEMPTEKLLDYTLKILAAVKADAPTGVEFKGEFDPLADTDFMKSTWVG